MNKQPRQSEIIKLFIVLILISTGLLTIYYQVNLVELSLGVFLLFIGIITLFFFINKNRNISKHQNTFEFDERSEINRLKASDISFKFIFISINILFILNGLNWIPANIIVAFLGPISAISILLYIGLFFWTERRIV